LAVIARIKAGVFKTAWAMGYDIRRHSRPPEPHYLELDPEYAATFAAVRDFTMTPVEKVAALVDAVRHIVRSGVPGAIVECGVWRGGSMMAAARTLFELGEVRDLVLFDTYAGMTQPTADDVDPYGQDARSHFQASQAGDHNEWCYASLEDVRANLLSTGYPEDRISFVQGDVTKTLPHAGLGQIALLRLDTDWYESTLHELTTLYPLLSPGGVLIIDDYGYWKGCKRAVDEFFAKDGPFLMRIDESGRIAVKPR